MTLAIAVILYAAFLIIGLRREKEDRELFRRLTLTEQWAWALADPIYWGEWLIICAIFLTLSMLR